MPTDAEPVPRLGVQAPSRIPWPTEWTPLPRAIRQPETPFLDVLRARRSAVGGPVDIDDLSSLLWHTTALRARRADGRFGIPWESRPAPSTGGLHAVRIIVLPLDGTAPAGEYLPDQHALAPIHPRGVEANSVSVADVIGVTAGTTLQFACDLQLLAACYENPDTLGWRDAGALAATIAFTATALGLTSVVLGRVGNEVLRAAGVDPAFTGVGAVHVGSHRAGRLGALGRDTSLDDR